MALIGFEMMTQYTQWRRTQHPIARRQLHILIIIVSMQTCMDVIIEHISFTDHLAGLIWGILWGLSHHKILSKNDTHHQYAD